MRVQRHARAVRVTHWVNAIALAVLFASGLGIFNAYPTLHWGRAAYGAGAPVLDIGARELEDGRLVGVTRLGSREFDTTGVLGVSHGPDGQATARAFPAWVTLPDGQWLAMSRRWHFFFAWVFVLNGLGWLVHALVSGHLRRDLWPTRRDLASIGRSVADHLRLRHPRGADVLRYNVLQRLAYLVLVLVLLPGIALLGLAMSPRMNALGAGWVDLFGGRDAARTLHFVFAWLIAGFVVVHLFEVLVNGPVNQVRSMLTGRYDVPADALAGTPDTHATPAAAARPRHDEARRDAP